MEREPGLNEENEESAGDGAEEAPTASEVSPDPDRLAETVSAIVAAPSINRAIRILRARYGAKHVAYVAARWGREPHRDPYVRTTYPPLWLARYLFREYWRVDPVGREGFARITPFDWNDIGRAEPKVAAFFADAKVHGVGASGLIVPLTTPHNQRGILSVNSDLEGERWDAYRVMVLKDFLEIGSVLHQRAVREIFGDVAPPRLSPREKEVLRWIGEGKEAPDIAIIMSLSEHTVRTYLKSARLKLDCGTQAQAAVKAERLALLESNE